MRLVRLLGQSITTQAASATMLLIASCYAASVRAEEPAVDFARDVHPILAASCLECHGADMQEGGLRLHRKVDALAGGDRGISIMPGNAEESRLIQYVTGKNSDNIVMPPEGSGERLSLEQIAILRAWIDQGAHFPDDASEHVASDHWAFQPIAHPGVPTVASEEWPRNGIDHFILARLEAEGIAPSPEADRSTLIRRLCLDLTGLPPTPAQLDEYFSDTADGAYERLVERLLASPHYGERWGRHWLDQARYADSDGYEKDNARPFAWRWRNWVIDAFNRDLPFDRFTIEQIAGDLLPEATLEQRIATGFHRNTLTNTEGGTDQEEFRVAATVDRVNTTGTVWLGLTVGCAQCHSHKYDPIAQREYYGMFAFYNSEQETQIPAPLPGEVRAFEAAKQAHAEEQARLAAAVAAFEKDELPLRQAAWEQGVVAGGVEWTVLEPLGAMSAGGATLTKQEDGSLLASGTNPTTDTYTVAVGTDLTGITAVRLEVLPDPTLPAMGPGRVAHGNFVLSEFQLTAMSAVNPGQMSVGILENATADFAQGTDMKEFPASAAIDGQPNTGWAVAPEFGKRHVAVFELKQPLGFEGGTELTFTLDQQHGSQHTIGRFRLSATTAAKPVTADGLPDHVVAILKTSSGERSDEQRAALTAYYRTIDAELTRLTTAAAEHARSAPQPSAQAMVLVELPTPRSTHVLIRGDFLRPGDPVEPVTPAVLHPLPSADGTPERLRFARWLVDPANPLTARVTVNRFWQKYFGRGLVASGDDFGTRGEAPSHPELLDWLAGEFMARGWSMKELHRLIVHSATYRQSSRARPELDERDPRNELLARQNRLRVEAEIIRDLALSVSGLLTPVVGGPSVRPPQPAGISELTYANSARWTESTGSDRYRRGMYTHFQRTSPYPMLMTFDAPESNVCAVKRERSNTPLQALTLLNDTAFFEAAQALGRRIIAEAPETSVDPSSAADARARFAVRLCLAREPSETERERLLALHADLLAVCRADPESAAKLAGANLAEGADVADTAAWVAMGRMLMNLDEFVTRE
jgi:hypothetical protein